MFNEIGDQLNEYDGKVDYENEINNEKDKLKAESESEEFINIEIKNQDINVIYRNISDITIKYYLIDIEILFNSSPFVKKSKVDFGFIKPLIINNIKVNKETNENIHSVAIPKELKEKNFFIEVSSGKKIENDIYYSSSLKYSIFESIGEIKVISPEQKALPEVYVKCFCETNNEDIKFYKDGFTDLRGKFDYVSLNNDLINKVKKFSILLVSKDYGSVIVYCNPPKIIQENKGNNLFEQMLNYRQNIKNKLRK